MSQLIIVREHTTMIPTRLLNAGGFRSGDQAVVEPVADGVLIRPLHAADVLGDEPGVAAWLPPVTVRGARDPLAA